MEQVFVYEDWTREQVPRCFYVGMGTIKRVKCMNRNRHHANITQKHGIERRIVLGPVSRDVAAHHEVRLIAERETFVFGDCYVFGANYTCGGERGTPGYRLTVEHRRKISVANQRLRSKETKQKMSLAARKRANDASWRELMSSVSRGRKCLDSTKKKLHDANVGKRLSDEHKLAISDGLKRNPNLGVWNRRENISPARLSALSLASSKPVIMCNCDGNILQRFPSVQEASQHVGVTGSAISHVLCGHTKTCKGYLWRYDDH